MSFLKNNKMNFFDYKAVKVWFTPTDIHVQLVNGESASLPLQLFPLLHNATKEQLEKVEIIKGYALHWPNLGEDLSVAGFFEQQNLKAEIVEKAAKV
jgi:hypothetical protein